LTLVGCVTKPRHDATGAISPSIHACPPRRVRLCRSPRSSTNVKYALSYIGPNGVVGQLVEEDQPAIQAYSPLNGVLATPVITHSYDPSTHDLLATGQPEGGVTK